MLRRQFDSDYPLMEILKCIECGYERSTEDDGRMFDEVCEICYDSECLNLIPALLCSECVAKEGVFVTELD